jgi:hypothetical protein
MPLKLYQKGKIIEPSRTLYIHAEHPTEKSARNRSLHSKTLSQAQAAPLVAVLWFFAELKTLKQQNLSENSEPIPFFLIILSFLRINSAKNAVSW